MIYRAQAQIKVVQEITILMRSEETEITEITVTRKKPEINKETDRLSWGYRSDHLIIYHFCYDEGVLQKLRYLHLERNKIESVQGIRRMGTPNLEQIYLWENYIRSVKAISRTSWKRLKAFNIRDNVVIDAEWLAFLVTSPVINWFVLEHDHSVVQSPDARWIHKIQCHNLKRFWMESNRRFQREEKMKLYKKYPEYDIPNR